MRDMNISEDFPGASHRPGFIRVIGVDGCSDDFGNFIKKPDSAFAERLREYRRVTDFPPMRDNTDIAAAVSKYEAIMNGSFSDKKFADSLKKVLALSENTSSRYNKTIEKNLAASLIFWCGTLLPAAGKSMAVCSGNIRQKEYLFCCLAFFMGYDVLLLTEGELSLPAELLCISKTVTAEELENAAAAEHSRANTSEHYRVNLNHPDRRPLDTRQAPKNVTVSVNIKKPKSRTNLTEDPLENAFAPVSLNVPGAASAAACRRELTFEELAQLAKSVVMIEVEDSLGNVLGSGSGVVIDSRGYILTNCHVAFEGKAYRVRMENDNCIYRTDRLLKYHTNSDLAIIRMDKPMTPLKIYSGQKELVRGQKVAAIGSPHGLFNSVSDGIISGLRTISDIDMIQFTAPTSGGSSGGALLNMYGELIGICTASVADAQNINMAVSYKQLIPFCQGFISADGK